ncbi:MCE family protein [Mycobacterium intracellulare]|uniref:MCE family protein n=1 Tax=Mycobacterium intracellulare TaxID=1767 RepID=UPI001CDA78A6|nr:MCE family protein [Mycobacterium intracellulare]MCA2255988.1 MCE family protein [Mycobacterium intracellulare]
MKSLLVRLQLCRVGCRGVAVLLAAMLLTSCGSWHGIANVPAPGGPGSDPHHLTVYVQMPETLGLFVNSRVRVADVWVGKVRAININDWIPTLTLDLRPSVKLPANATAKIGQTSVLGAQHVELAAPPDPSPQPLQNGDTIAVKNASAFPTTERVLASIGMILRGGGIPDLNVITTELDNVLSGRADRVRGFLNRLNTFVAELNRQRDDITGAIDSADRLLTIVAHRNQTLDQVLTDFPPLVQHFAEKRELLTNALEAIGRISSIADKTLSQAAGDVHTDLRLLQRPLKQSVRAGPYAVDAARLAFTAPYDIDDVTKIIRGDYINTEPVFDLTLSTLDTMFLTGTRFSGALRALEQSWGRDPNTMIPDPRFTPNPHNVPGGPLVERGE